MYPSTVSLNLSEVMSSGSIMDTTLPSTNSNLFNVPKLAKDGSNWITYKERTLMVIGARHLM
jgi:hypothetical protein